MTSKIFHHNLLQGKVALITGGGSGICKGIAEAFARHGANVVITGRSQARLDAALKDIQAQGNGQVLGVASDVRNYEQLEKVVASTLSRFGRLDTLVNGAAGNFLVPLAKMSPNAFKTVVEIDLLGTFNATKACFEALKESRGNIINISATLHYRGTPMVAHAGAAKAGIDALTKSLAREWGPMGIRINCIAPGPISETEGIERLLPKDLAEDLRQQIPLQRFGTIRDVEMMALFLAAGSADWITGQVFVVDGGEWLSTSGFEAKM